MIQIDGTSLTIEEVVKVARLKEKVKIEEKNKALVDKSAAVVNRFVKDKKLSTVSQRGSGILPTWSSQRKMSGNSGGISSCLIPREQALT